MHRQCIRAYRCFVYNTPLFSLFLCVTLLEILDARGTLIDEDPC